MRKKQIKNRDIWKTLLSFIKSFDAYKAITTLHDISDHDIGYFAKMYWTE